MPTSPGLPSVRPPWLAAYERRRYAVLFYSLLLTLAISPLLGALGLESNVLEGFLALNLLAAAWGASRRRHLLFLLVAVAAIALRSGARIGDAARLVSLSDLLWTSLAVVAAVGIVRFALSGRRVASEHVYAGLSAYLLLGHFFGLLYWTVEQAWPGSFGGAGVASPQGGGFALDNAIYFSFVTMATLGYGDVVPVGDVGRGLAVFEAIAGQLYIAVLIARLVGSYAAQRDADDR